jgi:DNA-binding MarR family transcriptional regulator
VTTDPRTAASGDQPSRLLDPAEQQAWRAFTDATRGLFDVLERQLQSDADMPLAYYEILLALSEAPDHTLRMGELARRLRSSSSRLSHAVSRLEAAEWARREHLPSDRRGAVAILTAAGAAALDAATPAHVETLRRHLLDPLTREQVTQLAAISRAILDANPAPPHPRRRRDDHSPLPHPRDPNE